MARVRKIRLCGGAFFALLHAAVYKHTRGQNFTSHGFDGLSQPELLRALLKVIIPDGQIYEPTTLKSMASRFKHCESVPCIPSSDTLDIKLFDQKVRSGEKEPLLAMNNLVEHFIDVKNKGPWLVKALLDLIERDEIISEDELLYVLPNAGAIKAVDLFNNYDFVLPSFLLGIWHYCVMKVPNNELYKDTFDYLYPDGNTINAEIGTYLSLFVSLTPLKLDTCSGDTEEDSENPEKKKPSVESSYFQPYFDSVLEELKNVNTIFSKEAYNFQDFYVPMDLGRTFRFDTEASNPILEIKAPNIENLMAYARCLLIQATGGMGKSMLMKHLMFDGVAKCVRSGRIPVFIELKNYTQSNYDVMDFFCDEIYRHMPEFDQVLFFRVLNEGRFVFLLDGLDEVNAVYRGQLLSRLFSFLSKFRKTQVVLSSRPYAVDIPLNMFKVLTLCPLELEQAVEILNRIEYYPDMPELKRDFIENLKSHLFQDYRTFARNPLLLSFMMIKFCEDGTISEVKSDFYDEVFDVLVARHDMKKGGYRRRPESGLTHTRLKAYFAAFCSMTFQKGELSFFRSQLIDYFSALLHRSGKPNEQEVNPEKLLEDYVSGICMLYKEGEKYYFVHRSFQEYFCACSLLKQRPEKLKDIREHFDDDGLIRYDMVLSFLYEKDPLKVEEWIFLPFLEQLLSQCENEKGYWTYVTLMYPKFHYEIVEDDYRKEGPNIYISDPDSFLLEFIFSLFPPQGVVEKPDLLQYDDYIDAVYTRIMIDGESAFTTMDQAKLYYEEQGRLNEFDDDPPPFLGYHIAIPTEELYNMRDEMPQLIAAFERDDFKLKAEYESLKLICEEMKRRVSFHTEDFVEII